MKKSKVMLGKKIFINKEGVMPLNSTEGVLGGADTVHQCAPSKDCTLRNGDCNERDFTATCPQGCVYPVYTAYTCSFSK